MSASEHVWDLSLTRNKRSGKAFQVTIPVAIARELMARGYNRTKLRITPEGLLFTPYHSDDITDSRNASGVTLPEWGGRSSAASGEHDAP